MRYNANRKKKICENIKGMGYIRFESLRDNNKRDKNIPIKNSKYLETISYLELKNLLDNDYILSLLKKRNKIRIFEANSTNLISKYRYDVFIKYYYVKNYLERNNYMLAKKIYTNHIKSFNNFLEPDGKKSGPDEFIKRFDILINDIKEHGIDKTIIPITKNGEIIDGAHRLSVALYLKLKVKFAIFDLLDANYNRDFFIRRGFNIKYAEIIDKEVIDKIK